MLWSIRSSLNKLFYYFLYMTKKLAALSLQLIAHERKVIYNYFMPQLIILFYYPFLTAKKKYAVVDMFISQ